VSIAILSLFIDEAQSTVTMLNKKGKCPLDCAKASGASSQAITLLQSSYEDWTKNAVDEGWSPFSE